MNWQVLPDPSGVQIGVLVFARCLGAVLFSPVFGRQEVSRFTRFSFAFLITFLVLPTVLSNTVVKQTMEISFVKFVPLILIECFWGCAIGLTLKVLFEGVYLAGETIAKVGGISVSESFDPGSGIEISAVSRFLFWGALVVFLTMRGFELFLEGFLDSFCTVIPGGVYDVESMVRTTVDVLGCAIELAFKLSAPFCVSTLVVYLTIGFLGRIFPQLNLMSIGFSCNSLLTIVILFIGLGVFFQAFQNDLAELLERLFSHDSE